MPAHRPSSTSARASRRRRAWLADLARDLPYALRSLRRSPGFTTLAVLTLAVGVGANAAIFSVVNAVLLRPLPYPQPERLARLWESKRDDPSWLGSVSVPNFRDWLAQNRSFAGLVAYEQRGMNLTGGGTPERASGVAASANIFDMLGARPLVGRGFAPTEDRAGGNHVVVLGEAFWRRRFAGNRGVVGRTLQLDGEAYTVIGIMRGEFRFPYSSSAPDFWVPWTPSPAEENTRGDHFLQVVGRLRPGTTIAGASREMKQIALRLERAYPDAQGNRSIELKTLQEATVGYVRPALVVLLGAVTLVLLIACANVGNLLLARAATRRRDVAVRAALGATRGQLVRQSLTEASVLALGATVLGALAARWSLAGLRVLAARALPLPDAIPVDGRVFTFLLAVALVSGIVFGLAPALQVRLDGVRDELAGAGKSTAGGAHARFRAGLVVAQIALSLVLLVGAGLLMRAFVALRATDPGLSPDGVVTMALSVPAMSPPGGHFEVNEVDPRIPRVYRAVAERVRAVPGVEAAGYISLLPIASWGSNGDFWVDGTPEPEPGKAPITELRAVSPGYFEAFRIPLVAGRRFTEDDGAAAGPPPILVNQALATRFFPAGDAVGKRMRRGRDAASVYTIVGVVGSVRQSGLADEPRYETYFPYATGLGASNLTLVVRSNLPVATVVPAIRAAAAAAAPQVPLFRIRTMDEVIGESLGSRRLNLWLLGAFAVIALVLAVSGLYGVISYLVAQRTREVGIRVALGATPREVVRLMLGQGARLAAAGIVIGVLGALAVTRLVATMLYGVGARDPVTFGAVALLLGAVALVASWIPARRAARVDPMIALRAE